MSHEDPSRSLQEIFGHPRFPAVVNQTPFDDYDFIDYADLATSSWGNIEPVYLSEYLQDLAYLSPLQQDLFDFLFPSCLIEWRQGLMQRIELPVTSFDFYHSLHSGKIFERMMDAGRSRAVSRWMAEAFLSAVETMQPDEVASPTGRNDRLHYMLWTFNGLGQVARVTRAVLGSLLEKPTSGKTRFWLLFCAGIAWPVNEVPWVSPWTHEGGGGGIYLLESNAQIFSAGFLPENLAAAREMITLQGVAESIDAGRDLVTSEETEMIHECLVRLHTVREAAQAKLDWFLTNLAEPYLGGMQEEPKFFG